jgi:hypothetical protein
MASWPFDLVCAAEIRSDVTIQPDRCEPWDPEPATRIGLYLINIWAVEIGLDGSD